ncbi:MAG TPA: hypothetical protein VJU79_07840, partial [Candidatus Dormibacteraeota bacterium]|nr:hypothetical protein [Candidatus Dormibacteraeota bacterium]
MRAIAAAFVVSAVIAVPAQASMTVGGVTPQGATSFNCGTASTHAQTSTGLAPPSYSIPFDGVLTSWRTAAESASTQLAQVRVLRPLTGDTFTVVGSTAIESLKPSVLNDNRPARIPVHAGDVLAMSTDPEGAPMSPSGVFCTFATGDTADAVR